MAPLARSHGFGWGRLMHWLQFRKCGIRKNITVFDCLDRIRPASLLSAGSPNRSVGRRAARKPSWSPAAFRAALWRQFSKAAAEGRRPPAQRKRPDCFGGGTSSMSKLQWFRNMVVTGVNFSFLTSSAWYCPSRKVSCSGAWKSVATEVTGRLPPGPPRGSSRMRFTHDEWVGSGLCCKVLSSSARGARGPSSRRSAPRSLRGMFSAGLSERSGCSFTM